MTLKQLLTYFIDFIVQILCFRLDGLLLNHILLFPLLSERFRLLVELFSMRQIFQRSGPTRFLQLHFLHFLSLQLHQYVFCHFQTVYEPRLILLTPHLNILLTQPNITHNNIPIYILNITSVYLVVDPFTVDEIGKQLETGLGLVFRYHMSGSLHSYHREISIVCLEETSMLILNTP